SSFKMRTKLMKHLLDSNCSSKRVRPVENDADTVNVTMDMTLSNVIDMEWTNEIMIWKPEEWSGIQTISVDAADIWLPDTILYNNVFEEFDGRLDNVKTLVRVHYTGKTTWNAPFIFKTLCKIKVKNFPFDRQQCKLKFGSWRYAAKELNLWFARKTANLDERRIKNGEWDVINVDITRNALVYPCCPDDVYPDITFIINIRRRSLYYIFNLIIPNFLIALLAFFSFYIPVECGERISFVMTVLLSMFVFLLLVAESIPPTSEAVPAIGVFFTSSIVLVALALVATGFVCHGNVDAKGVAAYYEDRIIHEIIGRYSSKVRPVLNAKDTVNVTLDITFNNIIDLDEKFQILKTSIWVRQSWNNPYFTWNVSEYGGLTSIIVDSRKIWLPDFALYNNIHEESSAHLDQRITRVRVYSSGATYWASPYVFKTLCKINVENFPFDTQKCKLTFGAWQYDGNEVNIKNNKQLANIAKTRVPSGEWDVLKIDIERTVVFYQCCPNLPYPEVSFIIHMKRKPLFFIVNLIIPNILIALLAFFSFFIPVECGERISFVITVLLSMTVFMLLIAESIPPTSDAVPLIGIYYTFSIIEVFLALAATAVSLKINYSYLFGSGLSSGTKRVIFQFIAPCLGFDVPKLLGVKTREKHRNPSSIAYRCNCCNGQRSSAASPTDDMDRTVHQEPVCNGKPRNHDNKQYNYLMSSSNKNNHHAQTESLMLDAMDGCMQPRMYYRRRQDHGMVVDDDDDDQVALGLNEEERQVKESKLAAYIIDRFFLWIFTAAYIISSALILSIPLYKS
ncbi:hypothetical protein QZH41_008534, partial [Actinostola sp. cb2023]